VVELQENTIETDVVKRHWKLTCKVKLTRPSSLPRRYSLPAHTAPSSSWSVKLTSRPKYPRHPSVEGAAPRLSIVGNRGNPGGLGLRSEHRATTLGPLLELNDKSGHRSLNQARKRRKSFRPSRVARSSDRSCREPCADKQRIMGRTALPVPTTLVVPLVRCIRLRNTQRRNALPAGAKCILTTTSESGKLCREIHHARRALARAERGRVNDKLLRVYDPKARRFRLPELLG
jgi:hypothetical protein